MSSATVRKRMNNKQDEDKLIPNDNPSSSNNADKNISTIQAIIGNIWFLGLCIGVAIVTKTYYELSLAFGIHYIVFLCYAYPFKNEKYYDFTGMIAFISTCIFSFVYRKQSLNNTRSIVLSLMVLCWTLRLGLFLFFRILKHNGVDTRFNAFKTNFFKFSMVWVMSTQWVYFCMMPIFIVNKNKDVRIQITDIIGWILFVFGWLIEILSDVQKTRFKANPMNKGKFIRSGLWKLSRHPNYFGDILLWIGIAVSACSVINKGTDWLLLVSPFWTFMLLVFMSGIPASEKAFSTKYKNVSGYKEYKKNTPILIPFCICWK